MKTVYVYKELGKFCVDVYVDGRKAFFLEVDEIQINLPHINVTFEREEDED